MATTIRPNVSTKNKYWIHKHRHYELKHFCLQYPFWKSEYKALEDISPRISNLNEVYSNGEINDETARWVANRVYYSEKIDLIEKAAIETDSVLHNYILTAVTEGLSYTYLKTAMNIPCSKGFYYDLYRKFFWILNKLRD